MPEAPVYRKQKGAPLVSKEPQVTPVCKPGVPETKAATPASVLPILEIRSTLRMK
jgi:hypothetical protein